MTRFVSGDCWYIVWMTWTNKYIVWICERCHICPRRNKNVVTEETRFFSKLFCDTMRRERCVENVDVHPSLPQTLRQMGLLSGDSLSEGFLHQKNREAREEGEQTPARACITRKVDALGLLSSLLFLGALLSVDGYYTYASSVRLVNDHEITPRTMTCILSVQVQLVYNIIM